MLRTLVAKSCLLSMGLLPTGLRTISVCPAVRSGEGLKGFTEHEKATEDLYFTKEDQRTLAKILSKVKSQSDMADVHAAAGVSAAEQSALKGIIDKYKFSVDDVKALINWKHTQF